MEHIIDSDILRKEIAWGRKVAPKELAVNGERLIYKGWIIRASEFNPKHYQLVLLFDGENNQRLTYNIGIYQTTSI